MSSDSGGKEIVEVVREADSKVGKWRPEVGTETQGVISEQVPEGSEESVRREAVSILGRCVPPDAKGVRRTGLVLGRIQSGKTLSFTVVSALAKDNGFQLIIVITGTRKDLFQQSNERLEEALKTDSLGGWDHYRSDELYSGVAKKIQGTLDMWGDGNPVARLNDTVLITVMKERHHLKAVNKLLGQLRLEDVPALIIDDEADRAGLNTKISERDRSATNERLMKLRDAVPHHTYLQYTATPQAILLLNLIDTLSPDFAQVLTPGSAYTGGEAFFKGDRALIRPIPGDEVPGDEAPMELPESLEGALRMFFVGAAAELAAGRTKVNRSMMVHPDRLTKIHYQYYRWIRSTTSRWQRELGNRNGPDWEECVAEFREAYRDLQVTARELPDFDSVVDVLPYVLNNTVTLEVNSKTREGVDKSSPNWNRDRWHILVGGDKLDRGLTIEGLTVSYMSRQRGVGNADTIQQRARWFGYKEDYLGLCRVFLPHETIQDYRNLVEHEASIRQEIEDLAERCIPVREWRRRFLLDRNLRLTRRSVVQNEIRTGRFDEEWFSVRRPHCPGHEGVLEENRRTTEAFLASLSFSDDRGDERRRESHRHRVAMGVRLDEVYELFLTEYEVRGQSDLSRYTGALMQIGSYRDEHPNATCAVYHMRAKASGTFERGLDGAGRIKDLFQGAYPTEGREKVYPGDRAIRSDDDDLTVQVHLLDRLKDPSGNIVAEAVPVLAVYIGRDFGGDWVVGYDITRET